MTEEERRELSDRYSRDAVRAYISYIGEEYATVDNFEESYVGQYDSDKEFAQQFAEDIGAIDNIGTQWPTYCIDWEYAARDLMMDCWEEDGFYFRST